MLASGGDVDLQDYISAGYEMQINDYHYSSTWSRNVLVK